MTPGNAANPVKVKAFGTVRNTTSSMNGDFTITRGGTAVGAFVSTRQDVAAANLWWPTTLLVLDLPNSVSAQTYAVSYRSSGSTLQWGNPPGSTGNNGYIEAEEIMG